MPLKIAIRVTNKTSSNGPPRPLFFMLEDAKLVYPDGRIHPLVQFVTKTSRKIAPSKTKLYWLQATGYRFRGLFDGPDPRLTAETPEEVQGHFRSHIGERLLLRLPVLIGETQYGYDIEMQVTDIESYEKKPYF